MKEEKELTSPSTSPNLDEEKKSNWQSFWELARFAIIAIAIVIPIRIFIAQPFIVSGSSMDPTFEDGQYLIIDEISYRLDDPERDDVVVFRYPNDTQKFFIKRIIGLPNETVDIKNNVITITNKNHPNGLKLDQSYIENNTNSNTHFELKDGEYFVMGDNRSASSDSRYWGAVPKKLLIGKVFLRLLPINKIDILPGDYKQVE
ncbi:signal peptidase I [Candidatus Nomurabacteria bacterium CG_4_9_14_0_2_um_filter_32_10]|uniref:Signal peptidase I n=3 Tax=Candidatus Nomuraibacteriota TaxID=1752729 RepID=A0A2H0CFZ2_9BACT|nr:MAG: signal peptidase I [Candidatus Nomurabacteria bacterium CG22_combo_CG10-13_8_21_14_all_32_8]PIZ86119.1 MAG: signal peptidase I [Candidatus Nomurabacteria bacterium CG_4_10_14_0_2_um_filter_33_9]PJC49609.1 MAG: signal peptidase I [Candidatus Nomurabacteria bacterium CG_4_9_14_0_2_um_filter_32_10]